MTNVVLEGSIGNDMFAIQSMMKGAPITGILREAVRNSLDAEATTIVIKPINLGGKKRSKAMILDNGFGMDEKTLKKMSVISDTFNSDANKNEGNFNNGIRIMGLAANEQGLVFISQKDGVVRSVKLTLKDGKFIATYMPSDFTKFNLSKHVSPHLIDTEANWTAVILMGNSSEQDTYKNPYGAIASNPFREQLENRFVRFTNAAGSECKVWVNNKTVAPIVRTNPLKVWTIAGKGFKVHYAVNPERPICGLIADGEVYDISLGKKRTTLHSVASNLFGAIGAYGLEDELSITVELAPGTFNYTMFRNKVVFPESQNDITLDHYLEHIVKMLPLELKEYIEKQNNNKLDRELEGISQKLQKELMKEMGLDLTSLVSSETGSFTTNAPTGDKNGKRRRKHPAKTGTRKPSKAEEQRGIPTIEAAFSTSDDSYQYAKHEIGYVVGQRAYFNPKHPLLTRLGDIAKSLKLPVAVVRHDFISMVSKESIYVLAYDMPKEHTGSVLLNVATLLISSGAFRKSLSKKVKGA